MVTFDECLSFTRLTLDEIDAIAHHERLTTFAAAELGEALTKTPQGLRLIRRFMEESIAGSRSPHQVERLRKTLRGFCDNYPDAARS
ncbi:MAG: hypothetical protein Kow006_31080 [Gammaproteobacteria bacterium]